MYESSGARLYSEVSVRKHRFGGILSTLVLARVSAGIHVCYVRLQIIPYITGESRRKLHWTLTFFYFFNHFLSFIFISISNIRFIFKKMAPSQVLDPDYYKALDLIVDEHCSIREAARRVGRSHSTVQY